ncbi:MAG: hypothetical protein JWP89_458 [Schlesneria sp.]|nr:hypothetical protein [Schlesneria sp.]
MSLSFSMDVMLQLPEVHELSDDEELELSLGLDDEDVVGELLEGDCELLTGGSTTKLGPLLLEELPPGEYELLTGGSTTKLGPLLLEG